jgi:hypothetical protein
LYEERREDLREEYQKILISIEKNDIIYLDESGFDMNMRKEFGWKERGKRLYDNKSGNRKGKRITVISALKDRKLLAPMWFEGNTDTNIFNEWIEKCLVPELKPNQVIVMDNATFHKSEATRKLIESVECKLLYLPPYSSDFNPIEQKWGHVKNMVKKIRDQFADFNECLDYALNTIC